MVMHLNICIPPCIFRYHLDESKCPFIFVFTAIFAEIWQLKNKNVGPVNVIYPWIKLLVPFSLRDCDKVILE